MSDIDLYANHMAQLNAEGKALVENNRLAKQAILDQYYEESVVNSEVLSSMSIISSRRDGSILLQQDEKSIALTASAIDIKFRVLPYPKTDTLPLVFQIENADDENNAKREITMRIFDWLKVLGFDKKKEEKKNA